VSPSTHDASSIALATAAACEAHTAENELPHVSGSGRSRQDTRDKTHVVGSLQESEEAGRVDDGGCGTRKRDEKSRGARDGAVIVKRRRGTLLVDDIIIALSRSMTMGARVCREERATLWPHFQTPKMGFVCEMARELRNTRSCVCMCVCVRALLETV
jgi:hypothetical protein